MTWDDLKEESTEALIHFIKCKGDPDYMELAEAAFMAFTIRFRVEVIYKCRTLGKYWEFDRDTSDSLAERTFERFWLYPFRFDKEKCGSLKFDECVKVYLFSVAQNCFSDYKKELSQAIQSPFDGSEQVIVEFPSLDSLHLTEVQKKDIRQIQAVIEEALSTLTPKHKTIYLTYKAHEKEGFKLPRKLLEQLRKETELNQNSIRVYKKQAFETVEKYKNENGEK